MATGYTFTRTGNTTKVVHITDDVVDKVDGFTGPVHVENINATTWQITAGSGVSLSFTTASIITIDGEAAAGTLSGLMDQLIAVFPDASSGGGAINFTELVDNTWDGNNTYTLAGNADVDVADNLDGVLLLTNPASHTFAVYGVNIPINNSGVNGGRTSLYYMTPEEGIIWVHDKDGNPIEVTLPAPDVTAPTITSLEATDANTIEVVFSEAVTGTIAGWSFDNGAALTVASRTGSGTNTWEFTITENMTNADTITFDYDEAAGDVEDAANNQLADDSGAVTNGIPGAGFTSTNRLAFYTNASMTRAGGEVTKWADADGTAANDFDPQGGIAEPIDATTDGLQITTTQNLGIDAVLNLTPPLSAYILLKKTAVGGLFPDGSGATDYGLYLDPAGPTLAKFDGASMSNATGIADMATFKVLTITWDGTNPPKMYLDGVLQGTFGSIFGTGWNIYRLTGSDAYRGYLNGLAFFSVEHDGATVAAQYSLFQSEAEA